VKHIQERTIILLAIITIETISIVAMAAAWPKTQEDGTIAYRGWAIYQPSNSTSNYVAMKGGYSPVTGSDLPDLIADIDEAMR
jgi:hypothetical protein